SNRLPSSYALVADPRNPGVENHPVGFLEQANQSHAKAIHVAADTLFPGSRVNTRRTEISAKNISVAICAIFYLSIRRSWIEIVWRHRDMAKQIWLSESIRCPSVKPHASSAMLRAHHLLPRACKTTIHLFSPLPCDGS